MTNDTNNEKGWIETITSCKWLNRGITVVSPVVETYGVKYAGKFLKGAKLLKSGSKILPLIGNIIGAVDDIYQEIRMGRLQDTTDALKASQSTMEGNITELQAGLKEAQDTKVELEEKQKKLHDELATAKAEADQKLKEQKKALEEKLEKDKQELQDKLNNATADNQEALKKQKEALEQKFTEDCQNLQDAIDEATKETRQELELQKEALEEVKQAAWEAEQHFQASIDATNTQLEEVEERMADSEAAINILQNDSLDQKEKTKQLQGIVDREKERIDQFEKDMAVFNDRLTKSEDKLAQHEGKINELHNKHLELEAKVKKNTADIAENKDNITENRENIAENKSNITKNTADITKNKDNITKNEQAINTETQERKAETGEIRDKIDGVQTKTQENKDEIDKVRNQTQRNQEQISATQKEFTSQVNQSNAGITQNTSEINRLAREQAEAKRKQELAERKLEQARKAQEEAEQKACEREAKIRANKKNTEKLQNEIKDERFKQAKAEDKLKKLLEYTRLKEEKARLTKELKKYEGCPDWVDYEEQQKEADKKRARQLASKYVVSQPIPVGLPLKPGPITERWRKGCTEEEFLEETGWEINSQGSNWEYWVEKSVKQIVENREKQIDTILTRDLFAGTKFDIVDSSRKDNLVEKLAKNKKILAGFCRELGLPLPEEEPIEIPTNPNPLNQKTPDPTEKKASGSGKSPITNQSGSNRNFKDKDSSPKKNNAFDKGVNKPINKPHSNPNPKENQKPEEVVASGSGTKQKKNQTRSKNNSKAKKPRTNRERERERDKHYFSERQATR